MGKATRPPIVKRVREMHTYGYAMVDIANAFGISARTVSNIVHGRTREGVPAGVEIPQLPLSPEDREKRNAMLLAQRSQQQAGPQRPVRRRGR